MDERDENTKPDLDARTKRLATQATSDVSDVAGVSRESYTTQPLKLQKDQIVIHLQGLSTTLHSLSETLRDEKEQELPLGNFFKELGRLANTVALIQDNPTEDTDFCIGAISEFLKGIINEIAERLVKFKTLKHCELQFESTAAAFTGVLLSEHMKRLENGDRYDVVSDLASWRDGQLERFREQTEAAVKMGVLVRRVFNLMLQEPRFRPLESWAKRSILEQHFADSETWNREDLGKYEVRVFEDSDLERLRRKKPNVVFSEGEINSHFGIFSHGTEGKTLVEYEVKRFDLSKMILRKDRETIQRQLVTFDDVWHEARPLNNEVIQLLLQGWKREEGV